MLTQETALELKNEAVQHVQQLGADILRELDPQPGPYALFFHSAFVIELLNDAFRIANRLFQGRQQLSALAEEELQAQRRMPQAVEMSDELNDVLNRAHEVSAHMKLDLETLYMFGLVLLDQWSLFAIYASGAQVTKRYPFRNLLSVLEGESVSDLQPLWDTCQKDFIWLDAHFRIYRNTFIVHRERPWQRGTTHDTFGVTFNFHTPTPPGWLDDPSLALELADLLRLAPKHIREAPDDYWEKKPRAVLERLFRDIDLIEEDGDRKRVARLFQRVGGSLPTFQITAERLFRFVISATATLADITKADYRRVVLGSPPSVEDEQTGR